MQFLAVRVGGARHQLVEAMVAGALGTTGVPEPDTATPSLSHEEPCSGPPLVDKETLLVTGPKAAGRDCERGSQTYVISPTTFK